jgi:hypothetical protein
MITVLTTVRGREGEETGGAGWEAKRKKKIPCVLFFANFGGGGQLPTLSW